MCVAYLSSQVVRVAESNGLKLPREFALLVKQAEIDPNTSKRRKESLQETRNGLGRSWQALYFDRYTKLLAPAGNSDLSLNLRDTHMEPGLRT